MLRPDGTVFYAGANRCGDGHTAIYDSRTARWKVGAGLPRRGGIADGPAALEPNGQVLMMASPYFAPPSEFSESGRKTPDPAPRPSQLAVQSVLLRQHAGATDRPNLADRLFERRRDLHAELVRQHDRTPTRRWWSTRRLDSAGGGRICSPGAGSTESPRAPRTGTTCRRRPTIPGAHHQPEDRPRLLAARTITAAWPLRRKSWCTPGSTCRPTRSAVAAPWRSSRTRCRLVCPLAVLVESQRAARRIGDV